MPDENGSIWQHVNGPEPSDGNIEYKVYLSAQSQDRLDRLVTQMRYRLAQGGGEAFYELGVSDQGELVGIPAKDVPLVMSTVEKVAKLASAEWRVTRTEKGKLGDVFEIHVRQRLETPVQLVVPLLGNVDGGKSTLVGVLCTGRLDNGDGESASKVARYLHEIVNRRTSSVSTHLLGFDGSERTVNEQLLDPLNQSQVYLKSKKTLVLVDLAGHERYLRTTLKGVLGHPPDYAVVVAASNMGTVGTFKEHVGICVVLAIPFAVVVTKTDLDPYHVSSTISEVCGVLKIPGVNKIPFVVDSKEDAVLAARHMSSGRIVPIFAVSSVNGFGLDKLRSFLDLLPPRLEWDKKVHMPLKMYVDDKFLVKGTGLVVSGMICQGALRIDQEVEIGPFEDGSFVTTKVRSIHVNRVDVDYAKAGQIASIAVTGVEYDGVDKGMVVLSKGSEHASVLKFEAEINVLYHPTTIKEGYQSVVHIQTHRQPAQIERIFGKQTLRTGDSGHVVMRLMKRPAYITPNDTLIFREGRTKGVGKVIRTL
ncbi:MAG: GTP-binding protein [Thermoprotei archaeon]